MDTTAVLVALLSLALAYFAFRSVLDHRNLSHFGGPLLASSSSCWLFWQSAAGRLSQAEGEAIERYGSPARIGPNLLVHNDPDWTRHLNAAGSKWRRAKWYEAMKLDTRTDTVFSTRNEKVHAELKAKEAGGYVGRDIATLESDIDARIVDLTELLRDKYDGTVLDLAEVMRYFTLDVLSTVAFGRPFGFMAANKDLWEYGKTNAQFMPVFQLQANHSWIRRVLASPLMQRLGSPKVTDTTGIGPALAFARGAVAERYGADARPKKDMLGHFVSKGLTQVQCEAEANLQIIAGSDSTTTSLRCTLFLLITNPVAYRRLRSDIDRLDQKGSVSHSVIAYSEAQGIPFLNACVLEGLRMYPPLFGLQTKLAPPGGDTVKGIFVPGETEVGVCYSSMCRRKDIFGEDSHVYRPERWIEADHEQRQLYQKTVDSVFGTGRFQCLGKHIAIMELHRTLAELVRQFDWSIADPMGGVGVRSDAVHVHRGMNVVARPR